MEDPEDGSLFEMDAHYGILPPGSQNLFNSPGILGLSLKAKLFPEKAEQRAPMDFVCFIFIYLKLLYLLPYVFCV
jgi:hypothetical protein